MPMSQKLNERQTQQQSLSDGNPQFTKLIQSSANRTECDNSYFLILNSECEMSGFCNSSMYKRFKDEYSIIGRMKERINIIIYTKKRKIVESNYLLFDTVE
jgi:hypothetical protein